MKTMLVSLLLTIIAAPPVFAQGTPSPDGAGVYFVNLSDGDTVSSPVKVIFGLSGMGVAPAGIALNNTGHHHLLVDRAAMGEGASGAAELSATIPSDDSHRHFGGGQTEVTVELSAGTHTLQLVLGDHLHVPHSPPILSEVITITVQ